MNLQVPITQMKEEGNWPLPWTSAIGLVDPVNKLGTDIVGCELGVSYGFNLVYFLERVDFKKVYAIDPYTSYWDGPAAGQVPQEVMDKAKELFLLNIEPYKNKVDFLNLTSDNAYQQIPENSLDYIFIDGDHSYERVILDVTNYYSKVRTGGIFAGHDYSWDGVKKAVEEFRQKNSISSPLINCPNDVWYWYHD